MNLPEFKAWFDGFTEGFEGDTPTPKQWKRIRDKIGQINNAPAVTRPVFIERYIDPYPWRRTWYVGSPVNRIMASNSTIAPFDSVESFRALGRAELKSL